VATKQRRVTKMMADLERWRREAVVWLGRVHHPGDGPGGISVLVLCGATPIPSLCCGRRSRREEPG